MNMNQTHNQNAHTHVYITPFGKVFECGNESSGAVYVCGIKMRARMHFISVTACTCQQNDFLLVSSPQNKQTL